MKKRVQVPSKKIQLLAIGTVLSLLNNVGLAQKSDCDACDGVPMNRCNTTHQSGSAGCGHRSPTLAERFLSRLDRLGDAVEHSVGDSLRSNAPSAWIKLVPAVAMRRVRVVAKHLAEQSHLVAPNHPVDVQPAIHPQRQGHGVATHRIHRLLTKVSLMVQEPPHRLQGLARRPSSSQLVL